MKILGIIPARYKSSRFPGKPLVDIQGKSMIERVYQQAMQANNLKKVIVATDDERIYNHVKEFGGEVKMTSDTHKNGTERCAEVSEFFPEFNSIINIQGDEPFIQPEQIDLLAEAFTDKSVELVSLVKKITDQRLINNPNCIKVVFNLNWEALYFSRSPIPYNIESSESYYKHIGIYGYRTDILKKISKLNPTPLEKKERLEQIRWLEYGFKIKLLETDLETLSVDTPDDLKKLEKQL